MWYIFFYSSPGEYLFKHIYVISKGGLTKGVICLALLGYFHASLSSPLSLSGSSSSLLAVKVVDSSIGPSPCLFRRRHALVCFYGIAWSIHLNIYLDLFPDICILFWNIELRNVDTNWPMPSMFCHRSKSQALTVKCLLCTCAFFSSSTIQV